MKRACLFCVSVSWALAGVIPNTYIVQLERPPALAGVRRGTAAARVAAATGRRAQIRSERAALRTRILEADDTQILDSTETVLNALIVTSTNPTRLAALPGVKRVYPSREYKLRLDRAVPLLKGRDAWTVLGGEDNAGAGVKIAILETGIDITHPAFQDSSLPLPDGFPKGSSEDDLTFTNSKVIVARSYGADLSPSDSYGHGTAVAMAAAGARTAAPDATISGMAPKAWLGNYKVSRGSTGTASDGAILKAIDDAVADGMDVINFSFGDTAAPRPEDDALVQAFEQAAAAGVIVVAAAGNDGPDPDTISSPATSSAVLGVGASRNARGVTSLVSVADGPAYDSLPGNGPVPAEAITAPTVDVAQLDQTGLACSPLPADSIKQKIALVLRGSCTFETKLENAQAAGASAAVVYNSAGSAMVLMDVRGATLPAVLIANADGLDLQSRIAAKPETPVTIALTPLDPHRLADFSSRGPNVNMAIKPDLVAVGSDLYTAAETADPGGPLYDPSGFATLSGTSFSSPLVAGAAALLKQGRPGLTAEQYRSLLVTSAVAMTPKGQSELTIQQEGAGLLDAAAALQNTVTASPYSVSFGTGGSTIDASREVTIANVGPAQDTFTITVAPLGDGPAPSVSENSVQLDPGAQQVVTLHFGADGLAPGEYQGFVQIQGTQSTVTAQVPYWYAVPTGTPAHITVLDQTATGRAGRVLRHAFYLRVTDTTGIPITDHAPDVAAAVGGGRVLNVRSVDADIPDAFTADVTLGSTSGTNVFEITAGDIKASVRIQATRALSAP